MSYSICKTLTRSTNSFLKDDRGVETLEYAVMTAVIAATLVAAMSAVLLAVSNRFAGVGNVIDGMP